MKLKWILGGCLLLAGQMLSPVWGQNCWKLEDDSQAISLEQLSGYGDHIEMSGQKMSAVLRWQVDGQGAFHLDRSLVFPLLRTLPDNTHASLMHRTALSVPSLVTANGLSLQHEQVESVRLDGWLEYVSTFSIGHVNVGAATDRKPVPVLRMQAVVFPSVENQLLLEKYVFENISSRPVRIYLPDFSSEIRTPEEKGKDGEYRLRADSWGSGTFLLPPHQKVDFACSFQACRASEEPLVPEVDAEWEQRRALVRSWDASLVLETPDPVIDREFRFAKIRAAESIFKTAGGYMHAPGGESYYAAIWANDQAEYINPFFPFLGYGIGNASALNAYLHFARFMNDAYEPLPSSIIAEGRDIWNGVGDRGDAAMIAHGATRYVMARGSVGEARQLWPLITWCLEYCHRQIDGNGVVRSDTDELEGRFPAGDANLCTSTLYYDALLSAAALSGELGESPRVARQYRARAREMARNIEKHFGAEMEGFHTYRYFEGNDKLRSWICMPLIVGLEDRKEGTIAALTSPLLMTDDGILTEQGSNTFWDRSTLYALRGIYISGDTRRATGFLHHYSERRLLGNHVPYPIEAYPEGSQRHLSAESGLYCRVIVEGLFGIRPMGLKRFELTPRLPEGWNEMHLRHIRAFDSDWDLTVERSGEHTLDIRIFQHGTQRATNYSIKQGNTLKIEL